MYFQVRQSYLVRGMSVREASRVFGVHRDTVRKMLTNATPSGYTRKRPPPTRSPALIPRLTTAGAALRWFRTYPDLR